MATVKTRIVLFFALCWWCCASGQPVLDDYPSYPSATLLRDKLVKVAESQLYVREATGENDGREVEKYLRVTGLKKGNPWCAAYVAWCHTELNIPNPESAWSPNWFRANLVYRRNVARIKPFKSRPGQVFGLYYENKKRVAHIGLITGETLLHYTTIEGNTNGAGSNEGDGVYRKIRKKETIYMVSDYAGYREILSATKHK